LIHVNSLPLLSMSRHIFILFILIPFFATSQISEGGYPFGFDLKSSDDSYNYIILIAPDVDRILADEQASNTRPGPYRIGEAIATDIDLLEDGGWREVGGGERILRLGIRSDGAKGLVLYYSAFSIPEGGRLYIYSKDRSQLIGAFTHRNNPSGGYFATEMIIGDELVIEYDPPQHSTIDPVIKIYQVHYIYKEIVNDLGGQSGPCEVNVNCPEGANWQNEKRSVAKILLTDGNGSYLCTGSLLNNMRQDTVPYFLTARHCGSGASAVHFTQWVFYFNYESPDCDEPVEDPPLKTITGCVMVAQAADGPSNGSDFRLLELSSIPPEDYNPWFAGWNHDGLPSPSGVGIHHPQGDIKKISTYSAPLVATNYSLITPNPDGNYWKVTWVETISGHGVTEGGSSGSPIFDNSGKLVGTLTGGAASCSNLLQPDYYGRFSKHWDSNGVNADSWLKPWLDPENTGTLSMEGFGYGNLLSANFKADTSVISAGGRISFYDHSLGEPEQWDWTFYGAEPAVYSGQNPSGITYNEYGEYSVMLAVRDGNIGDELYRENYIRVTPNIYPNPAHDYVVLDFGRRQLNFIEVDVFDTSGRKIRSYETSNVDNGIWRIQLDNIRAGTYYLRIKTNVMEDNIPLVVY